MNPLPALIAMSGGVDSAVAAHLTLSQGIPCGGASMLLCPGGEQGAEDARCIAQRLGIPFQILSLRKEFEANVIDRFVQGYEQGLTPNPCIECNRTMKFGILLDKALELGYGTLVTGHYACVRRDSDTGRYLLYRAADRAKDQTYFLACLNQAQLARVRFPLGALTKEAVRAIAQAQGFVNARKKDSQDICFVPDGDYAAFLEGRAGKPYPQGSFLNLDGAVVGTHRGAVCYTLGQRKGLGLAMGEPVYVCQKDMDANTVTVGPNEALFSPALRSGGWNWLPFPELTEPLSCTVRIRHSRQEHPAVLYPEAGGLVRVEFEKPQRAVCPGQAVVAYLGDLVLGGGTILEAIQESNPL